MQRSRVSTINLLYLYLSTNKKTLQASSFAAASPPLPKRPFLGNIFSLLIKNMSTSTSSMSVEKQFMPENRVQQVELLNSVNDLHGGVVVNIEQPMDSKVFSPLLRASISQWRQQGKRGVWIKLPIEHANLVEAAVKEGFRYHHAEPDYLMLVCWLPETTDTIPQNASHRIGVGAFVMNNQREVLVVQENSGKFKGTGVWKLPTGVVNEGEDLCTSVIREVKEETGWMPIEDYAAQPFIQKQELFNFVAKICLSKSDRNYVGFSPLATTTASGKTSYLYFNNQNMKHLIKNAYLKHDKLDRNYVGFSPLATTTASGKTSYLYFNNQNMKHLVTSDNQQ
ncbi:nudix hydrolase 7 [Quercus suber]|uniref:Nudix hydrolase 7 n=1 Tax=Quercus suber TaxID=58331 RepID=A0AAW0ISK6_QUESU